MKTLDELWYGNIAPFEQCSRGDKRFAEMLKLVNQNRDELVLSSKYLLDHLTHDAVLVAVE